ncbi:hypothetical protein CDG60_13490 [Acinetobacter chinensis]|jgi:hypothetical protein|uniref:Uncharacterized protein n=1 Tax=Acinetobacter chinensis TaxID=2004650 RepID=A0A3B7LX72_9GAMM|nr:MULTISPECIES: hypothetical protein [Acinetobacter]AXY57490.1 hypothetical protein CDG60_13490 [Acinetobacter chinensis]AXY60802.1 hypothetical protein CDG61_12680 [Acinetobacter sp. WCHAc010052]MDV2467605.1 hypothetical protein [Acinetobacter chinensis]
MPEEQKSGTATMGIQIGQQVRLTISPQLIFTVQKKNMDGSFTVSAEIDSNNNLSYDNISAEMLCLVDAE